MLDGGDGRHERERARADRPSAIGRDLDYRLTDGGARRLRDLGVDVDGALAGPRAPIRYCVDWSEQDHHLSGALGAALAARLFELDGSRACRARARCALTDDGRAGLAEQLRRRRRLNARNVAESRASRLRPVRRLSSMTP